MKKITYYLHNLISNIKYLMVYSLRDHERELMYETLNRVEDIYRYEIMDPESSADTWFPRVLNYNDTIDLLKEHPKSFCRFGDGEVRLMQGESISFQKYDPKLAEGLLRILRENTPDLYVGLNYNYYHSTKPMGEFARKFYFLDAKPCRDFYIRNCNRDREFYIAAGFNQLYANFEDMDFDAYYKKLRALFTGKKLVAFIGKNVMRNITFNIFDEAESVEYVYGPARDAFDNYEEILEKARTYSKDHTLCFVLGPASKVLAYDLSKLGYVSWDIGHMVRDYDAYRKKEEKSDSFIKAFYAPEE